MEDKTYPDTDTENTDQELEALLEQESAPPEAFYQALKNALAQLEQDAAATWA